MVGAFDDGEELDVGSDTATTDVRGEPLRFTCVVASDGDKVIEALGKLMAASVGEDAGSGVGAMVRNGDNVSDAAGALVGTPDSKEVGTSAGEAARAAKGVFDADNNGEATVSLVGSIVGEVLGAYIGDTVCEAVGEALIIDVGAIVKATEDAFAGETIDPATVTPVGPADGDALEALVVVLFSCPQVVVGANVGVSSVGDDVGDDIGSLVAASVGEDVGEAAKGPVRNANDAIVGDSVDTTAGKEVRTDVGNAVADTSAPVGDTHGMATVELMVSTV